jgi:hypothetical protein
MALPSTPTILSADPLGTLIVKFELDLLSFVVSPVDSLNLNDTISLALIVVGGFGLGSIGEGGVDVFLELQLTNITIDRKPKKIHFFIFIFFYKNKEGAFKEY